jgi:hypothetical protein
MTASHRTRPAEQAILERACRHYFSLPNRVSERQAFTAGASALLAVWESDWTVRLVRICFNNNRDRLGASGAGLGDGAEERHLLLLSRLEPSPEGQLVRTALLVERSSLPLRVVADSSFRTFMRKSAGRYCHPSVAQLRNAILRIADQFRLEFTPAAEQRKSLAAHSVKLSADKGIAAQYHYGVCAH